jgi:toxin ParE1/3/4
MDGKIVRSSTAARDLVDLYRYIAEQSGDHRAEAVLRRIETSLKLIADNPEIGRLRRDLNRQSRTFSIAPWIVIYTALPDGDGVFILRVVDGRRDLPQL